MFSITFNVLNKTTLLNLLRILIRVIGMEVFCII